MEERTDAAGGVSGLKAVVTVAVPLNVVLALCVVALVDSVLGWRPGPEWQPRAAECVGDNIGSNPSPAEVRNELRCLADRLLVLVEAVEDDGVEDDDILADVLKRLRSVSDRLRPPIEVEPVPSEQAGKDDGAGR